MGESAQSDRRPSPDALLREAEKSQRGRLKIFLGAAPGVGKTYEMLSAAQARLRGQESMWSSAWSKPTDERKPRH